MIKESMMTLSEAFIPLGRVELLESVKEKTPLGRLFFGISSNSPSLLIGITEVLAMIKVIELELHDIAKYYQ